MKPYIYSIVALTLLAGIPAMAAKKPEKKKSVTTSDVKKALKATDGKQKQEDPKKPIQHYYKNMKFQKIGYAKWKLTYFHIYSGFIKDRDQDLEEYRALVFNNKAEYLGYYAADEEVEEVDDEGIKFNYSSNDDNIIEFDPKIGLPKESDLNGETVKFVPFEIKEEPPAAGTTNATGIITGTTNATGTITGSTNATGIITGTTNATGTITGSTNTVKAATK